MATCKCFNGPPLAKARACCCGCGIDDAKREYEYGAKSHIGTFSDSLMAEAKKRDWTVISVKNGWKCIFASANQ